MEIQHVPARSGEDARFEDAGLAAEPDDGPLFRLKDLDLQPGNRTGPPPGVSRRARGRWRTCQLAGRKLFFCRRRIPAKAQQNKIQAKRKLDGVTPVGAVIGQTGGERVGRAPPVISAAPTSLQNNLRTTQHNGHGTGTFR